MSHVIRAVVRNKKGIVIGTGQNSYAKTHPLQAHFAKLVGKPDSIYLHAEITALLACGRRKPHSIYVERVKKDGTKGLAKPCSICQAALKAWGVKHISYTENL